MIFTPFLLLYEPLAIKSAMNKTALTNFKDYFQYMKLADNSALENIYADNIQFVDPIHELNGLKSLSQYFEKLNKNLVSGAFEFTDETVTGDRAFLSWNMVLRLKKPKKEVSATGLSVLIIEDKIVYQRDYFDAGELFYEHIPVLGNIIKIVKKQIAK